MEQWSQSWASSIDLYQMQLLGERISFLAEMLTQAGLPFCLFHGGMSSVEKSVSRVSRKGIRGVAKGDGESNYVQGKSQVSLGHSLICMAHRRIFVERTQIQLWDPITS